MNGNEDETVGFTYHLIRVDDDGNLVGVELDDQQVAFGTYFEPTIGCTLGRLKIGLSGQQVEIVQRWWRDPK